MQNMFIKCTPSQGWEKGASRELQTANSYLSKVLAVQRYEEKSDCCDLEGLEEDGRIPSEDSDGPEW